MSFVGALEAEFHKSPLLAISAVAAVVGAVVLIARSGGSSSGAGLANPQSNLSGGGGSSAGGGGAGLGQGDPTIGTTQGTIPVPTTPGLSASDVAAAINQAVSALAGSISSSNNQLQGEINQLAAAIPSSQAVSAAPRTPLTATPDAPSQEAGLLQQLLTRLSSWNPTMPQIATPTPTLSPVITAAPRTFAVDGQSLASQSAETIAAFQATYGGGAASAWVTQHEQELATPKTSVTAFNQSPAVSAPPPASFSMSLISQPHLGVDYGPLVPTIVQLPQPSAPIANVDYGPATVTQPAVAPVGAAAANEARFTAQQQANPSNIAHYQPKPPDAPTSDTAVARGQTSHLRVE